VWHVASRGARLERNDAIAWGIATGVWLAVLGLLLWLASRERRSVGPWLRWLAPRVAGGLALWVAVFGATRWAERKLGLRSEPHSRAVRSGGRP
jgi:peptidoglycan/LPS O-acetylase OafA/YrhL